MMTKRSSLLEDNNLDMLMKIYHFKEEPLGMEAEDKSFLTIFNF